MDSGQQSINIPILHRIKDRHNIEEVIKRIHINIEID